MSTSIPIPAMALVAGAVLFGLPAPAFAQDKPTDLQDLGFDVRFGLQIGGIPGLSKGVLAGLVLGGGPHIGPVRVGADLTFGIGSSGENGGFAILTGATGTVGWAAPARWAAAPIADFHAGWMSMHYEGNGTRDGSGFTLGATLGAAFPASRPRFFAAGTVYLPLFTEKLAKATPGSESPVYGVPILGRVGGTVL